MQAPVSCPAHLVLNFPAMDLIAARKEALEYLAANSVGRQGEIAEATGLRRETVNRYAGGHATPVDIDCIQRIINWMNRDRAERAKKKNGGR